ncbi:hypothetical protein FJZ53_01580 [Candidatus Woesearchaeota archaeon]|nr:hypothetical protein [Candidatus Woesearchaeota archaeon]
MDREKAAKMLAKELGDKYGRAEVIESSHKDSLIKNASAAYQVGKPFFFEFNRNKFSQPEYNNYGEPTLAELVLKHDNSFTDANYFFLERIHTQGHKYGSDRSRFTATPYALIGDKEKTALRKLFYKDVHPEIAYAMSVLEIGNFIDIYRDYKEASFKCPAPPFATKVLNEDLVILKTFVDFAMDIEYDDDKEASKKIFNSFGGIESLNTLLKRNKLLPLESSDRHSQGYVHRTGVSVVVKHIQNFIESLKTFSKEYNNHLTDEFIDFVFFSLPYEEQNIESNKHILKNSQNLDFVAAALSKEYSEGNHFQEYFEVLDKENQTKIVESLKSLPNKKPVYDSFLWSKGFQNIELDYISIYKDDTKGFIEYFKKKNVEEKKTILKDILNCDSINEEVANWLNQNEADLIREVGFNG